ncbi:hypothetical protein CL617_04800 [archaeon]|nr:hypothetical protein [archaeon]|tara:strand:+ start:156 stop:365 length:210 start_codon:yes stop_codon:yes gene_type:complete
MGSEVNTSTVKYFLSTSSLNSKPDTVETLKKAISEYAKKVVAKSKDLAIEDKKKTIFKEHVEKALEDLQ